MIRAGQADSTAAALPVHTLVTGAASGIGAAAAACAAARGPVTLVDCDEVKLHGVARHLSDRGATVEVFPCDVTDRGRVAEVFRLAGEYFGPIGAVAHCAGIVVTGPVLDVTDEQWDRVLDVNLRGVIGVLSEAIEALRDTPDAAIVVVGSNAGRHPRMGLGAYGASKAAAHSVALTLALEAAPLGIRINVVAPGSTNTPMQTQFGGARAAEAAVAGDLSKHRLGIPLGRIAEPEDIAAVIDFLLSPASRHITAEVITVDGGATV